MPNLPKVGLDALRIQDSQQLKNALLNCDDPMKAISDFQEENCILLPTLKPALNLIDLHNVRRLEFHMSIADELKDHLTKRVEDLASVINLNMSKDIQNSDETRKLEELLEKSFPLIK
jgi:negative elongation factor B